MISPRMRGVPSWCLALLTTLSLAACTGASADQPPGLADLLPSSPGGSLPSSLATQQSLDAGSAASALPSDSDATSAELAADAFRSGYVRIWGSTAEYASMAVLSFGNVAEAARFLAFERSDLSTAANTYVSAHAGIPGSFVFVITSATKQNPSAQPVFCNGVWFAIQDYVFEGLACGATPSWATQVEQAAQGEYSRAKQELGA